MSASEPNTRIRQRKQTVLLLLLAVAMFGFAFALVPLYEVFCELTGLNGKTGGRAIESAQDRLIDETSREVNIQFLAHVGNGMPWEFRPLERQLRVRTGQSYSTRFYVRNRASQAITGQAVPSVAPGVAALHLQKTECFCFTQQRLDAGQSMEMPLTFIVDLELPEEIRTLTLSYTLFRTADEKKTTPNTSAPLITDINASDGQ